MFITNNHALLHLWWKEKLLKLQKVSKYYDYDYRFAVIVQNWKLHCETLNVKGKETKKVSFNTEMFFSLALEFRRIFTPCLVKFKPRMLSCYGI